MIIPINKVGNIEIEQNLLKFRMPINDFSTTDIDDIEKSLKRKIIAIQEDPYYMIPSQVESINTSVIFYYQLDNYKSFGFLRQLRFEEKLKYFSSLVEIAKKQETTKVLWDQYNFVVDTLEEKIKAIIFETDTMKVYEKTHAFKGIKELILISLTNLDKILGKPSRNDFIDKQDYVIQFAETVLKIDNLEDLDHYINTKVIEFEHSESRIDQYNEELDVSPKKKIKVPLLSDKKKQVKPIPNKITKKKKVKGKDGNSNKMIIIGIAVLVVVFVATTLIPEPNASGNNKNSYTPSVSGDIDDSNNSKKVTNPKYNEDLLEAYRLSLSGDSSKAITVLEEIGYNNLSSRDKTILLNLYKESNMIHRVIDLEPKMSKEIVNELIANGKEEELIKFKDLMETTDPYVEFEVAYLQENWEKVIGLKNEVDLNGRKEQQIVESYIALEKYEEGIEFAEKVGNPELLESIKTISGDY